MWYGYKMCVCVYDTCVSVVLYGYEMCVYDVCVCVDVCVVHVV